MAATIMEAVLIHGGLSKKEVQDLDMVEAEKLYTVFMEIESLKMKTIAESIAASLARIFGSLKHGR
jgi:hypothetical protein